MILTQGTSVIALQKDVRIVCDVIGLHGGWNSPFLNVQGDTTICCLAYRNFTDATIMVADCIEEKVACPAL